MVRRLGTGLLLLLIVVCVQLSPAHKVRSASKLQKMTIGMGYVPNVQFAPFYVANARGYYRQAGLQVDFNYAASPNLLQLVGSGQVDVANADGTDVVVAVSHSVPVIYVMGEYQRFPITIFSLSKRHIRRVIDLKGRTIGVPGFYGATYTGLLVALHEAGLRAHDVHIQAVNYTQAESVATGKVDAAVGYSANEPLQLERRGYAVTRIEVGAISDLVAPGLITGAKLMRANPRLVRRFVQATLHGLADTIRDPAMAFAITRHVSGLTGLQGRDVGDQYSVLLHTVAFWHSAGTHLHGLGYTDPRQWRDSVSLLHSISQITTIPTLSRLYTNDFAEGSLKL